MAKQRSPVGYLVVLVLIVFATSWFGRDFITLDDPNDRQTVEKSRSQEDINQEAPPSIPATHSSSAKSRGKGSEPAKPMAEDHQWPVVRGVVDYVQDGDSLILKSGSEQYRVRFWGIDAPEGNTKQPFARESREHLRDLCQGKRVRVEVHDMDRYERKVGEVFLEDGRSLNREMVSAGLAWYYVQHAREEKVLGELEASARQSRRGLWSDDRPTPPWEWRQTHAKPE